MTPIQAYEELQRIRETSRAAEAAIERLIILRALDECDGNVTRAARALGLHRNTIMNKMREATK